MPKNTALETLTPALHALPQDQVQSPQAPVHVTLRSGRTMLDFALLKDNARTLEQVGFGGEELEEVRQSLEALDQAQQSWRSVYNRRAFEGALSQRLEDAYDLRDRVLRAAEFNLSDDPQLHVVLQNVRLGEGHGDLVEDLGVLARVLEAQKQAFAKDKTLDVAATVKELDQEAKAIATELAQFDGSKAAGYDEAIELRDRASTFAQHQLRRLRRAGRYAFQDHAPSSDRFVDTYQRDRKRAQRDTTQTDAPQDTF